MSIVVPPYVKLLAHVVDLCLEDLAEHFAAEHPGKAPPEHSNLSAVSFYEWAQAQGEGLELRVLPWIEEHNVDETDRESFFDLFRSLHGLIELYCNWPIVTYANRRVPMPIVDFGVHYKIGFADGRAIVLASVDELDPAQGPIADGNIGAMMRGSANAISQTFLDESLSHIYKMLADPLHFRGGFSHPGKKERTV